MTDDESAYARTEQAVWRYAHAHGKRVIMPEVLLEMIATALGCTRCEYQNCGNPAVRVIVVHGFEGERRSEVACPSHVGPMIAHKCAVYVDNNLPVPAMRYETI